MVNSVTHSRVLLILATSTIVVCSEFRAVFSFILIKKNVLEKKRKRERIIEKKIWAPNVGLEPTTLRLRVSCSTDWASRALAYAFDANYYNYTTGFHRFLILSTAYIQKFCNYFYFCLWMQRYHHSLWTSQKLFISYVLFLRTNFSQFKVLDC